MLDEGGEEGVYCTGERKLKVTFGTFLLAVGVIWVVSLLIEKIGLSS